MDLLIVLINILYILFLYSVLIIVIGLNNMERCFVLKYSGIFNWMKNG